MQKRLLGFRILALFTLGFTGSMLKAQLTTVPSANATFLVGQLIGPGVTFSNATMSAPANAAGTFNGTASNIGLPGGVLLTSGDVANAVGPNLQGGITTANSAPGDPQLDLLASPFLTEDACILEFDMVATCDTIQISYVFGSDEYDEYVCSQFTDVFAFFISGPGITGSQNIAVIPGTSIPIAINTVNIGTVGAFSSFPLPTNCNTSNAAYFTTNNTGATIEYDGFTVPLIAKSAVIPCSTYHIKLAIADAGDDSFDSGVFLEQGGIRCASAYFSVEPQVNSPNVNFAVEGCVNGGFTFIRDGDTTQALTMYYSTGGTATPGADYPPLPGSVTFPPMGSSVFVPISAISDGLAEGTETILVILSDTVCNTVVSDTAILFIGDEIIVDAGADQTICDGDVAQLGAPALPSVTYAWTPTLGLSNAGISDPSASPSAPGVYTYVVSGIDSNLCQGTDTMVLTVIQLPNATFNAPVNVCTGLNGTITYTGSAPLNATYNWNFGGGTVVSGSGQGPYQVSWPTSGQVYVTLQVQSGVCTSETDSFLVNVTVPPTLTLTGDNLNCFNIPEGGVTTAITNGTAGFSYLWSNGATTANISNVMAGTYSVTVTDAVGCTDVASVTLTQPTALTNALTFTPILCNGGTGLVTANPGGGSGTYTYLWSNGATTQSIAPVTGTYTVTVTDANSGFTPCTISNTITLQEPPALAIQMSTTIANCGLNTGTAGAIPQGGTTPYSYQWSTGATTAFITNLGPGPVTVTVTDGNGCTGTVTQSIVQTPVPTVTAGPDASFCEGEGGVGITCLGSGGTPGYSYTWSCASSNCGLDSLFDDDPHANPSVSQWYYIQITDANGCLSNVDSLFVTVLPKPLVNAGPDIYLCGDSAPCQVLHPTITNAPGPYTYQWLPGSGLNNATIENPCARPDSTTIYALVVTAGNGCTSDYTTTDTLSTIVVNVNPIPIADGGPDQHICLHDSVLLPGTASGAGPLYEFEWSPTTGLSSFTDPTPTTSPPITTTYTLVVMSNNCPSYGDSVTVFVHTIPTVDAGWAREICLGESTLLDATAGGDSTASYNFVWTPPLGFVGSNTVEDPTVNPVSTTTYTVQAISSYGCGDSHDTVTVYLKPTPVANAGPNITICHGDSVTLPGSFAYTTTVPAPNNQVFYAWSPASWMNDSTNLQPVVWPEVSTVYHLQVRHMDCATVDSVLVSVGPETQALAGADTTVICELDSVQLSSAGSVGNVFLWSPASSVSDPTAANPMAGPKVTTTYWLVVGEAACQDSASVTIEVLPRPMASYLNSPPVGCAPLAVSFSQTTTDANFYIWDFGDGSPISNELQVLHTFEQPGAYPVSLTVVGIGGCSSTATTTVVNVGDQGSAEFSTNPGFPAQFTLPASTIQFTDLSENASTWTWDFGDGIRSDETHPVHTYHAPGTYFVQLTVETTEGCRSQVTHGPFVVAVPDIFIPNVFSPNGDGSNDVFLVNYTGDQAFLLSVMDRWGVPVYNSNNKTQGWDGTNATGQGVAEGVYYYVVKAGDREFTGNITLVR